jgi:hypothetical protein
MGVVVNNEQAVAELLYRELVARGFELRIATALSDMGVDSNTCSSCSSSNIRVGRPCVQAGVDERHFL